MTKTPPEKELLLKDYPDYPDLSSSELFELMDKCIKQGKAQAYKEANEVCETCKKVLKERMQKAEQDKMKQEVHNIIRKWDRELTYGTEINPYKKWARLKDFSDAVRLLEARLISKIKESIK